ncbi:hypothetical protein [Coraliomargarita parva]|uniref:hypothetical protein n=1 Tax=Coraliomargarita parva TaxID=3014050 RepID=UPI0022B4F95A|nr:hypothetical protein [Coraliomargarita parva]
MKHWLQNRRVRFAFIGCLGIGLLAFVLYHVLDTEPAAEISDFSSDGCSLFPDRSLINKDDWCQCCFEHDIAYWKGGTEAERLAADAALRDCVLQSTGNHELAETMYLGVRLGGSPYFKNWYRWGYGWNYERKYRALSEKEETQAAFKLAKFYANNPKLPCSRQLIGLE